jgi:hypothetical protein
MFALKVDSSFLLFNELHEGQVTSFCVAADLCSISNLVLHSEHLYSNSGINNPLFIFRLNQEYPANGRVPELEYQHYIFYKNLLSFQPT